MTQSTRKLLICSLILFVSAACATNPATEPPANPAASPTTQRITSESVVKAAAQRVDIPVGGSAEAIVRLTIQSGYHVNANPPTYSYLRPTVLEISTGDGLSVAFITYPNAVDKKFPFAEKALAVYEGQTDLKPTLAADKAAKKGERSIPARLRIQDIAQT